MYSFLKVPQSLWTKQKGNSDRKLKVVPNFQGRTNFRAVRCHIRAHSLCSKNIPLLVSAPGYRVRRLRRWLGRYFCKNKKTKIRKILEFGILVAGVVTWFLALPVDVVKSRYMYDGFNGMREYRSATDCFCKTYKNHGITAFYKGLGVTLVRAFPVNLLCFVIYEQTLNVLRYKSLISSTLPRVAALVVMLWLMTP